MSTKFWIEDPCVLFTDIISIFPTKDMTKPEKLNALMRLVFIITVVLYFMNYKHWFIFLAIATFAIVLMNYVKKPSSGDVIKEDFTIVPTYTGQDFQQTTVSPTFSEEWQIPPPAYDIYTQVPPPEGQRDTFETPLKPQSYPYGQYLTKTNLLPSDEYFTHLGTGGAKTAREYVNSTFLRHDLAFRDNMTRLYKKKLNRRFRHNTQDTISPYHSY
jgi:hypothetical protein